MNQLQTVQKERSQLLQSLLKLDRPLDQILLPLNQLGWDSDEELATLHPQHLISILNRYLNGELSPVAVENWANAIECREDLDWESEAISSLIHELANPLLTRPLSEDTAREWLEQLTTDSEPRILTKKQLPAIAQMCRTYFHQEWNLEAPDALGVIRNYIKNESISQMLQTIEEIDRLLSLNLEPEQLKNLLESDLNCYYNPAVYGISHYSWLLWVQISLKQAISTEIPLSA